MHQKTRLVLASLFIATFFILAGWLLNSGLAGAQSREEPAKPPSPVRPPGTTGGPAAQPETAKPSERDYYRQPATRQDKREGIEGLKKQKELKKSRTENQKSPGAPPSKPPDPRKPPAATGTQEY